MDSMAQVCEERLRRPPNCTGHQIRDRQILIRFGPVQPEATTANFMAVTLRGSGSINNSGTK
jgi:hypothetical protein